jgi:hypothetical protein
MNSEQPLFRAAGDGVIMGAIFPHRLHAGLPGSRHGARLASAPRRQSPHRHPIAPKVKDATEPKKWYYFLFSEATMSAHAFEVEVLSRARNEIEVCHTAEGH